MRSETAVPRRRVEATAIEGHRQRAFPQLKTCEVGLTGLEPAASSLSGIFAGCVQAARAQGGQLLGGVKVTVVVRWIPGLSRGCGTRMARAEDSADAMSG